MELPELALPDYSLWCSFGYGHARNKDQGDDDNNDKGDANGEDEEEVRRDEFMFGEGISTNDVSLQALTGSYEYLTYEILASISEKGRLVGAIRSSQPPMPTKAKQMIQSKR